MAQTFKLFDVVALTEDLPQNNLLCGQVGTIVENLAPQVYEVEFSDQDGQTYAMLPLHSQQLLRLHYLPIISQPEPMTQIHQNGQGDNIAGDKVMGDKIGTQNNFSQTNHGGTNFQTQVNGGTVNQAGTINITNNPEPQTAAEAAKEIQELLLQLAKDNPLATDAERADYVQDQLPPSRLKRSMELFKAAGTAAIEMLPGGTIATAVFKKYQEQEQSIRKTQDS